mmetsp:Transcript_1109/g.3443  ORF Transcript_1109/g.3443 Transcript_1109/m.3443 type:complete len:388 (+) Transcript_1109:137-1300(+)
MRLTGPTVLVGDELGGVKGVSLEKEEVVLQCKVPSSGAGQRFSAKYIVPVGEGKDVAVGTSDGRVCQFAELAEPKLLHDKIDKSLAGLESLSLHELLYCSTDGQLNKVDHRGVSTELFEVGDNVCFMRLSNTEPVVIVGGEEHEVELWDVRAQKSIFCARNVKADNLGLRQPVHNRAGAFISEDNPRVVCAGTAFGDLRIYDTRSGQRRPIKSFTTIQQKRNGRACEVTCISVAHDSQSIVIGNSEGDVLAYDVRTARLRGAYRGHAGAVSSAIICKENSAVVTCGADRFLHVHDFESRHEIAKVYLRNQLSGLTAVPEHWIEPESNDKNEDSDDDQKWLEGDDDEDESPASDDVEEVQNPASEKEHSRKSEGDVLRGVQKRRKEGK